MKKITRFVLANVSFSLIVFLGWQSAFAQKPTLIKAWETTKELKVPESVLFDEISQTIYVSNINGKPTEKNNMGFIAALNLDGTIKKLKWVTGMNAPKGMGIWKRDLYVTDIDRVHVIDIQQGTIRKTWDVKGAKFLNDIAIDKQGVVYITDMAMKSLHAIKNGELNTFINIQFNNPNGLFMSTSGLLVGTAEGMLNINTQTRVVSVAIEHKGGIDGLKPYKNDQYIVSDWAGKTQLIEKGKPPAVLLDTSSQKVNAADFEYITKKKLLLIPTFFDNRIVAYQLK